MFYANLLTQTKSNSDFTPIDDIPPFALLKYDQNIWILYAWLIPVCYGKQKGKEKKAIRFRLNCPHLNLFSLSPFFFFTCAFYRDILNSHTCTRVQFEGRMHKVMWAELKSLCSTYLFCAPAWLFTTSNSYICIYCQGLLSRFIQIKSVWFELNAWMHGLEENWERENWV